MLFIHWSLLYRSLKRHEQDWNDKHSFSVVLPLTINDMQTNMSFMDNLQKRLVAKSNYLIEASYKLSVNEQRLVLAAISKIDSRKKTLPANGIKITTEEFAETYKGAISKKTAYNVLQESIRLLYERSITKIRHDKGGEIHRRDTRWLSEKEEHVSHDGYVVLHFSDRISAYLLDLSEHFTRYTIKSVAGLRSAYSIRLFEMLIRFKKTGFLTVKLEDFKERMATPKSYKWNDVKVRVIEPAIKELKKRGQLEISYHPTKKGRSYVGIEFHFRATQQMAMDV